ncbi:RNA-binding protein, putative [Plasmodium gallinaceum]|uniref:RNA-binding protein, putative n=1 Tax=Plasmodium gallinaceum TaxID=5849 RepID=A0A1J1H3K0_PLAGA|nr:RNA-binding protein, putative [Plasmodium gallinaceum]CRG97928.1 RNA-binding protein, putative [Plasmodium gallinaceum]
MSLKRSLNHSEIDEKEKKKINTKKNDEKNIELETYNEKEEKENDKINYIKYNNIINISNSCSNNAIISDNLNNELILNDVNGNYDDYKKSLQNKEKKNTCDDNRYLTYGKNENNKINDYTEKKYESELKKQEKNHSLKQMELHDKNLNEEDEKIYEDANINVEKKKKKVINEEQNLKIENSSNNKEENKNENPSNSKEEIKDENSSNNKEEIKNENPLNNKEEIKDDENSSNNKEEIKNENPSNVNEEIKDENPSNDKEEIKDENSSNDKEEIKGENSSNDKEEIKNENSSNDKEEIKNETSSNDKEEIKNENSSNDKEEIKDENSSNDKEKVNNKNISSDYGKDKVDYIHNYQNSYYNMYNMNSENYMNYPYYYNQYYNVVQSNPFNNDINKENSYNINELQKNKKENLIQRNNFENEFNMDDNNTSNLMRNISNVYVNNPINNSLNNQIDYTSNNQMNNSMNNYYSMYNYNYMNNMNNMNYNYYYGLYDKGYDYNKNIENNMKSYDYCSLIDKSIELMKKSDKVKEILKTPARLQITQDELNKIEYTEGNEQYNIWFGKYVTDRFDKSSKNTPRFVAKYKCNPIKDSGYTKADKVYNSKQYFCIYFARGCCAYGHNCLYKHRIPNENDEIEFEASIDIFGREKFNTFKDDMTGVGNFNNDCRTLFIGSIYINNLNEVSLIEKILYDEFINFGNIDYVRFIPNKNIAFIQFTNRVNAEFAKVAMSDQPIENHSTALTIKWAFELKNQPHHLIQYYNNPYIYNQNQIISSTWENYIMQQQYNNVMFNDYNNINNNSNAAFTAHYKKINDRCNNLNNSLNKIDQMFDMQNKDNKDDSFSVYM